MKQKHKLILDAGLAILLILLMWYSLTGGLIHEILGIVILVGFIVHVILNRKYYGAMIRALQKKNATVKTRIAFAVNILLPVVSVVMLLSSVAISHDLFPAVSDAFGNYGAWVMVHVISAVLLTMCVFVHVCLHAKMFLGVVRSATKNPAVIKAWRAGSRVLAVVLAVLIIKASIESVADATVVAASRASANKATVTTLVDSGDTSTSDADASDTSSGVVISEHMGSTEPQDTLGGEDQQAIADGEDNSNSEEILIEEEPVPEVAEVSLEDYLSSIKCTACSKHCLLIAPKCNKGVKQAAEAETEYYEIYGE